MIRRLGVPLAIAALAGVLLAPSATATPLFPTTIDLPNGFQPEGIAIGPGPVAYFGSLADGSIYRADLVTGRGRIVSEGPGTHSVGMKTDTRGLLYVAGGAAGDARIIDTRSGRILAEYALGGTFVNDVVLTERAAWFTDSQKPVLYRIPLGGGTPTTVPLTGDLVYQTGFNVNGIERTPDGRGLLLVQSNTGKLFRADVDGVTHEIESATTFVNGDGLLLRGRTLYVVLNQANQVAVVHLDRSASVATLEDTLTDPRFDVPTTVAAFGDRLYLPNARFGTPPGPDVEYQVVAVRDR
jgi:sugar lactone lactonase YvrE